MKAHTPGPWGVGWREGLSGPTVSPTVLLDGQGVEQLPIHAGRTAVCFILRDGDQLTSEDKANARLIAAAPELYEAACLLLTQVVGKQPIEGWIRDTDVSRDAVTLFKRAIDKVNGEAA